MWIKLNIFEEKKKKTLNFKNQRLKNKNKINLVVWKPPRATPKNRLGVDRPPYKLMGAAEPPQRLFAAVWRRQSHPKKCSGVGQSPPSPTPRCGVATGPPWVFFNFFSCFSLFPFLVFFFLIFFYYYICFELGWKNLIWVEKIRVGWV